MRDLSRRIAVSSATPGNARSSIEQLYHEHHQPLRRYLARLLEDPTTAEDLCHETFVKALLHCNDRDKVASARGWLYRIAKNTAYDHLRRQRRVMMTPLTDTHEAIAVVAARKSQFADAEPICVALTRLPEHYRDHSRMAPRPEQGQ